MDDGHLGQGERRKDEIISRLGSRFPTGRLHAVIKVLRTPRTLATVEDV
jgi:hypothetical protein